MNQIVLQRMARQGEYPYCQCHTCADLKKACYRRLFPGERHPVYAILPCHVCCKKVHYSHELSAPYWELMDVWRDETEKALVITRRLKEQAAERNRIQQLEAFDRNAQIREEISRRIAMINGILETEQSSDPAQGDAANDVDEEI